MTGQLKAGHLPHLVKAFREALERDEISSDEAYDFCEETYQAYLDNKVRRGEKLLVADPALVTSHGKKQN